MSERAPGSQRSFGGRSALKGRVLWTVIPHRRVAMIHNSNRAQLGFTEPESQGRFLFNRLAAQEVSGTFVWGAEARLLTSARGEQGIFS
jgi:hypothetical protein